MNVQAHAKINLSLEVLGRRADGFHSLRSVMQEISLCDELEIDRSDGFNLVTEEARIAGNDNLVARAARLMWERCTPPGWCRVRLHKRIPIAAGLGGGSSDAAATLWALRRLWQAHLTCRDYLDMAKMLGSDVPFFLYGGTALVEGRGERVTPLPGVSDGWLLLVNPGFAVSTASVFAGLRREEWSDGRAVEAMADEIRRGNEPGPGLNGLQPALFRLYPEAERCFREVEELAPGRTIVSGSGPTVVARFASRGGAADAAAKLRHCGYWTASVEYRHREGERSCP